MKGLRLLLVTDAVGGVWVYSLELARALRGSGVETVLAVMGPPPSEQQRTDAADFKLIDTGLPLEWLDTDPAGMRRAGERLAAIARSEGVDLVQTSSAALLADATFPVPCIAVQHSCVASWWAAVKGTPLLPEFEWRRELVQRGLSRAAAIVAPTIAFAAETARVYDTEAPVQAVHNGRRPPVVGSVPQGEFVLVAGRLWDEGKNAATLDCAAERVDVPFQAVGPLQGPNGASIELRNMRAVGELSSTRLTGLFAARPVFASAATYEPFGLTALEAAHAACALVLSDIPTHRELWDDAAIFVPPRDDRAFASAIEHVMREPSTRADLGRRASVRARFFTPERMCAGMMAIYERLTTPAAAGWRMAGAA